MANIFQQFPTAVMGILNITRDSFSDGGHYLDIESALAHAENMRAHGADIVDIGGESTRPGATRVSADEEYHRVIPVVEELARRDFTISVDTMRADIAQAAIASGAHMINDVSAGLADSHMFEIVAEAGVPICLMHWKTERFGDAAGTAHSDSSDIALEVSSALRERVRAAQAAGIRADNICIDPGLGFAKTPENNWSLLHHIGELQALGYPVLIGASRKRFLAALGTDLDQATAAVSALAAAQGAWGFRVHAIAPTVAAIKVAAQWTGAQ
ncbi:dihydropteroate synthase [Corynebacterium sp. ES2794-CONJ1]|uniref:dihydropteroate synthase n=1 Tax=unclassified Corynebacterium TaxID=2624378 RepID=UPI00216A6BEE|nr:MULTISPECIES: dihydropteroate synthase [unclassified Corynebacterium]MCS4490242.1 dihydropteroate synthase [Corynebacterium sp. ES2775-CONJ]MCS4491947.1 dihydropteroate synthase [Corynebacterium sp. ES2715-CONJ3]MCS4532052.1 dihydropteroate synthase [Corynebacterium sp. ES2730-CONJ]MCU9519453.1 dihydropteroate synthase [Corynebacterium sp. ES2794-CONJ1]